MCERETEGEREFNVIPHWNHKKVLLKGFTINKCSFNIYIYIYVSACVYIYTHMHTLYNRFLVSLFFKPSDKPSVGDFQSGASPRSRETFPQTFCFECTTTHLPWWKGQTPCVDSSFSSTTQTSGVVQQISKWQKKRHYASLCRTIAQWNSNILSLPMPPPQDLTPTSQAGLQVFVTKKKIMIFSPPSRCTQTA